MAQFNSANSSFQTHNKTLFEVNQIATIDGNVVTTNNPFPVTVGGGSGGINTPVTVNFGGTTVDAFGRLRASDQYTIFDSTLRYSEDSRNWDNSTTGSANTVHNANSSSTFMNVGTSSGDKVIRQTKRYFQYQPGKSLLSINTFTMQPKANVRQRVGYFNEYNGIYLEHDGTNLYIVKRSYSTDALTEVRKVQSEWSEDTLLDGSGPSGKTLSIDKVQIWWTDIEWLGAGTVRVGFIIDGEYVVAHKFHHANIGTSTYMTTASLPIRYEIENTDATDSPTSLEHICNSIISEGGFSPKVITRAASTALSGLAMSTTDYRPLIAIRLKSSRPGGIVVPAFADIYGLQTTPFNYKVIANATITGGSWVSAGSESHVEYNITATALTGGNNLLQGMFIGGTYVLPTKINFKEFNSSYQLRTRIDGSMETFVIAAVATTNNDDALASLTWEEYN